MSEMHWTGAAVLLALAILGGDAARPRPAKVLSWAVFAPEHDLDARASRQDSRTARADGRRLSQGRYRPATVSQRGDSAGLPATRECCRGRSA
jgi:hypothetical protein